MRKLPLLFFVLVSSITMAQVDSLLIDSKFNDTFLEVKATYYYLNKGKPTDSIFFTLNPAAEIVNISAPNLEKHQMAQRKGLPFPLRLVKLRTPLADGARLSIQFDYRLDLEKTNFWKNNWAELLVDQFWFPNANTVTNKFTSRTIVRNVPAGYQFFSYLPYKEIGNQAYQITQKEPFPETAFLVGKDMTLITKKKGKLAITFFASKTVADSTLNSMFEKLSTSVNLFNTSFGKSAPVRNFSVALRTVPRKVVSSQTTRSFMILTSTEFNTWGDLSHELGHFWWNKANFTNEPWMNESFANYTMLTILEKYDPEMHASTIKQVEKTLALPGAVATMGVFMKDAYLVYYYKGTALMRILEKEIGREKMEKILAMVVKTKADTTDEFLAILENVAGTNVRTKFEESLQKSVN
jgi:hypothetical protein